MKTQLLTKTVLLLYFVCSFGLFAQGTTNLDNLLTTTQWNTLFPKRAGTFGAHPQGYNTDFYSFENLKQAVLSMNDYLVQIRKKPGVWGELITITKKSTNQSYNYADVETYWYSNTTPETVITVDFATFLNEGNLHNNKRELAAFLANISKETTGGWQLPVAGGSQGDYALWGLYFVHEVGYTLANSAGTYSQASTEFPPNPSKGYYGRGPIQLSWNYNYGQFSKFLYNDVSVFLNNPDLLQQDGVLAFQSAIWFWMMPQWPKPSCHQVMHDFWIPQLGEYTASKMYKKGFAHVNNIINGGLECRNTSTAAFTQKVTLRSELYKYYLGILGFLPSQIEQENSGYYSTLCYENNENAMQDYISGNVLSNSNFEIHNLKFYPNPTVDKLFIEYVSEINHIVIYNSFGQLVFASNPFSKSITLNMSFLPKGSYIVKVTSNQNDATIKMLKQ